MEVDFFGLGRERHHILRREVRLPRAREGYRPISPGNLSLQMHPEAVQEDGCYHAALYAKKHRPDPVATEVFDSASFCCSLCRIRRIVRVQHIDVFLVFIHSLLLEVCGVAA